MTQIDEYEFSELVGQLTDQNQNPVEQLSVIKTLLKYDLKNSKLQQKYLRAGHKATLSLRPLDFKGDQSL